MVTATVFVLTRVWGTMAWTTGGGAVGVGVSIGASMAVNVIAPKSDDDFAGVRSFVKDSEIDANGALNMKAEAAETIRAAVLALGGRKPEAVEALREALDQGYSVALARRDEDLAVLEDLPAFKELMSRSQ